jgi:hypothetical protein
MTAVVFLGPTMSTDEAALVLPAIYLPPAARGDVYRAALDLPKMIGLIDGNFRSVPAVWHKEILWAMAQGVHVFGAASIGALRAAELATFGMEGVGRIFEAYRDGTLEDDDEVTLTHGPPEIGYLPLSEAMVNIRATLNKAAAEDVIGHGERDTLEGIAKALHYSERRYETILEIAAAAGMPNCLVETFLEWLSAGKVDLKRQDAVDMLHRMKDYLASNPHPKQTTYYLELTETWLGLSRC